MDPIEYPLAQRRQFLRRGWIAVVVVVIAVAGVALSPVTSGHATAFLAFPGLIALIVAVISFNIARARTVVSADGIRTGTLFGRHACSWADVADIETVNMSVSRYSRPAEVAPGHGQARIRVVLTSGQSFQLSAPRDLNGVDAQLGAKYQEIRNYWTRTKRQARKKRA